MFESPYLTFISSEKNSLTISPLKQEQSDNNILSTEFSDNLSVWTTEGGPKPEIQSVNPQTEEV